MADIIMPVSGAWAAAEAFERAQEGVIKGLALEKARAEMRQIGMQELENALLQPTRIASQIAKGRQGINQVRQDVITPGERQEKMKSVADKFFTDEEIKEYINHKYGAGDESKAAAYLKEQAKKYGSAGLRRITQDAIDSLSMIKGKDTRQFQTPAPSRDSAIIPSRSPQSTDPVAAAIESARAAQPEATPQQVPPQPKVIGVNDLVLVPPPGVAPVAQAQETMITPDNMVIPNPFSIEGQLHALAPALNTLVTDAELDLMKAEQQNEFLANKMMTEYGIKIKEAEKDREHETTEKEKDRETEAVNRDMDRLIDLYKIEKESTDRAADREARARKGGKGAKNPFFDVVKKKMDEFDKFYRNQGRKRDEDVKVLRELSGVYRMAGKVPELQDMLRDQYGTAIRNAERLLPNEFKGMSAPAPGKVKTGSSRPKSFSDADSFLRRKALSGAFMSKHPSELEKSLEKLGLSASEKQKLIDRYKSYFKGGK